MMWFVASLFAVAIGAGGMWLYLIDFKGYEAPPAPPVDPGSDGQC